MEYLILAGAYDILCLGKNDESASKKQQKPHEVRTRGVFCTVLARWLRP